MQTQYSSTSTAHYNTDADICGLFGALSLRGAPEDVPSTSGWGQPPLALDDASDSDMSDYASVESGWGNNPSSTSSSSAYPHSHSILKPIEVAAPPIYHDPSLGCEALQTIQTHIDWHTGVTTSSSLLNAVLEHRQAFITSPREHKTCSKALTQLAFTLEQRNSEGDTDTAVALRYESWLVSGWS